MTDQSVEKIRKLLEVIDMKRRDLTKYRKEMIIIKNKLTLLLETNDQYRSDIHNTNIVLFQQNNIEIFDTNKKYQDAVTNYNKTQKNVEHLEGVIGNYNINHIITDIKTSFTTLEH